jgi:hypothetical protein
MDADGSWRLGGGALRAWETAIVELRAALDRVRDARGDDEAGRCGCNELLGGHRDECPKWGDAPAARSPQSEDHEALYAAACHAHMERVGRNLTSNEVMAVLTGVRTALSRVSPSRDGTVAVEDVAEALRHYADDVERVRAIGGEVGRISVRLADWLLAEFGSARGESKQNADGG